jgi:ABC-2 family transporter protein
MIRLAALQARMQMAVAAAGLAAVAVLLLVTGPHLVDLYRSQIEGCAATHDCSTAQTAFLRTDQTLYGLLGFLVLFVPAVLGVFLGASLVAREFEHGTHRLAWTQSVSRTRWLAVKMAVIGLAGMTVAGLVSLFVTWWAHPLDRVRMDQYGFFDQRAVVPVAYAAFAIALGVACGILLRRTLPAMAATLAGFVAVRLGFALSIRPHLLAPSHITTPLSSGNGLGFEITPPLGVTFVAQNPTLPNAMVLSSRIVDAAGHPASAQALHTFVAGHCPAIAHPQSLTGGGPNAGPPKPNAFNHCIQLLSGRFHLATTYQPPSRYWPLQWSEFGIFMAAALVLAGVSVWRIRRGDG